MPAQLGVVQLGYVERSPSRFGINRMLARIGALEYAFHCNDPFPGRCDVVPGFFWID
jgi:hypothetical protein